MKAILSTLLIFVFLSGFSQKVTVSKDTRSLKGGEATGYSADIKGASTDVLQAFNRFVKDFGKIRTSSGIITVSAPVLGGNIYDKNSAYAIVKGDAINSTVWMGIIKNEWPESDTDALSEQIKDIIYRFGITYYRNLIQQEIDQTQQALDATDRRLQKLIAQNKDFNTKLIANEEEKIRLEKAIAENKNENLILNQKIQGNKVSQDSVTNAAVQIKKVLDAQKERQQKVN